MSAPAIIVPAEVAGLDIIASASGGKDSTALLLALTEAQVPFRAAFADTGWEADETYEYLETLRRLVCPIEVARPARTMVESIRHRAGFPARMQRWCTRELKIEPLRAFHDEHIARTGTETVSAMGIRAEESTDRAAMAVLDDEPQWVHIVDDDGVPKKVRGWGGWVWRPLMAWTIDDVVAIHHRHNVPLNPLYLAGFDRVGCYPCIFSRKEEIRLIAERTPERIDLIEQLEREQTAERAARNLESPGRYKHPQAPFFQTRDRAEDVAGKHRTMGIRDVVNWARTDKGGRQFPILQPAPSGGCMRWGICEAPAGDADTAALAKARGGR